ncbi:site-specific integrase [Oscillochloris sp. ZM17-4]|uniref:tyrosine-type recombinase/integrase n=1 Tax=Oscillochloris sp. ZM17-4 TaxID=2866714 RepID=UPI001C73DCDC|nr:site-specific integrase [Oscillochloris sp. ZM17-4]MBX0330066.1 site-specific integrase [Oscillochloris sp. ZM17-4]
MPISFAETLDAFLSDPRTRGRLKPSTLRAYRKDLAAAAAVLPPALVDLTGEALGHYLDRDIAPSTAARRLAALRALCAWALRDGYLSTDPTASLESPRRTRRLPRPIRADADRQAVARAITAAPQPFRLALTILRETGMRAGEVLALNLGDVVLDPGREALHVRDPKNRTERMVVLGPTATPQSLRGLRAQLRSRKGEPDHAPLFRSNRGTRLSYDALHYQWAHACADAGLADDAGRPRYTLHQLRHTRATELVEQGQRLEIVQRVLGHRDPRSTQGYAELAEAHVRDALEQPS